MEKEYNYPSTFRKMRLQGIRPADDVHPDSGFIATVTLDVFMPADIFADFTFIEPVDISAFLTVRPAKGYPPTNVKKNYPLVIKPKLWKEEHGKTQGT